MNDDAALANAAGPMPARSGGRGWVKPVIFIALIALLVMAAKVLGLGERLGRLQDWMESLGAWAPLAYALIYAVATVAAVPASALTVAAGALFGSVVGVITVSLGSTLGASLSFLVARYFARDAVSRWLSRKERFRKLDRMTETRGVLMVAFTRLVPVFPFVVVNYGFGLTRVRFWTYVFWSWLCMIPGIILCVVGADAITKAVTEKRVPLPLILVFAVAVVAIVLIARVTKRKLSESEEDSSIDERDSHD